MAEGGGEFGYDDPLLDNQIDNDDDDEQEVNRSQTFQPGTASTPYQPGAPYHWGEQMEIHTMQHKQFGLPETSYGGTPGIDTIEDIRGRLDALRDPATGIISESAIPLIPPSLREEEIQKVKKFIKARYPNAEVDKLVIKFSDKNQIVVLGSKQEP